MHFYSALLTLFLASSVGATNSSSVFCPFDVPTTSFPIKLRSSAALSLPFPAPQLSVFNSSLPLSPILPLKQYVKKPFVNVSQPIVDPFLPPVGMEFSMLTVFGWALLNILMNFVAFSLIADAAPEIEEILAEIVADLEEEDGEYEDDMVTPEMQQFLLEIIDFDLKEEDVEEEDIEWVEDEMMEDDIEWVEEDFDDVPCAPPPSPVSEDEESHC